MKINLNGDSIYTKKFPDIERNNWFASFNVINNNIIFAYEQDSSFGLTNGIGLLADTNGNIIKKKVFTNSNFRWGSLRAIIPISNGDLLFAGTAQLLPFETRVVYCVRTDSLLNTSEYIGINNISSNAPEYFKLFQNYPNPFNPTTSIRYEIPKNAQVTIKIYDILGKEVFSLNEYKLAGSYEVKFDGSNLASGMYFYSFETNGFKDTKKMVLLK